MAGTLWGCGNRSNAPDVSGVPISLQTIRFEQDFCKILLGEKVQVVKARWISWNGSSAFPGAIPVP